MGDPRQRNLRLAALITKFGNRFVGGLQASVGFGQVSLLFFVGNQLFCDQAVGERLVSVDRPLTQGPCELSLATDKCGRKRGLSRTSGQWLRL